jgi:hypothetical protein
VFYRSLLLCAVYRCRVPGLWPLAWLSKCRGILIRWEKKPENYLGLLKLACGLLWFRRYHRLTAT